MTIDDFTIKIKKYDREKQFVIFNLTILGICDVRGFRARYGVTKHSSGNSVWIVSPPAVHIGKNYFWIFELKDNDLWQQITTLAIKMVREYTNTY